MSPATSSGPGAVAAGRKEGVEVPRIERPAPDQLQPAVVGPVELLVLVAAVDAHQAPGEVVVDGRHGAGRNDEAEQREGPVGRSEDEPLADPAAHPAARGGGLGGRREAGAGGGA